MLYMEKTIFKKAFFIIGSSIILVKAAALIHDFKDNGNAVSQKAASEIAVVAEDDTFPSGCDGDCANCKMCRTSL